MRWLKLCLVAGLLLAASATAWANTYDGPIPIWVDGKLQFTISNSDLATMRALGSPKDPHPDGSLTKDPYNRPDENNVQFNFKLDNVGGFRDFLVGWQMAGGPGTLPSEYWDLSDFESMTLSFHNETTVPDGKDPEDYAIMVNLFMNTGWTDQGEPNLYAQNEWTWILPGESVILDLDFSNAQLWGGEDNHNGDWGAITNLHHVSALGFNIGSNMPGADYSFPAGYEGQVCIDTVPEPLTMLGVFMGIGGLAGYIRKRRLV